MTGICCEPRDVIVRRLVANLRDVQAVEVVEIGKDGDQGDQGPPVPKAKIFIIEKRECR